MNSRIETYLVTQADLSAGRTTPEIVEAAIAGGIDMVQVREKNATARERLEIARDVRESTAVADVPLIVNDRIDIALAADADGVHVGDEDPPIEVARELMGEDAIVGRSVSTVGGAQDAEAAGADYLGVGSVFSTSSKDVEEEKHELGLDAIRAIDEAVEIPIVGIGGVTVENAEKVVAAGADGVAVISAITTADDPTEATRALGEAVDSGKRRRKNPSGHIGGVSE